jgi:hypothetical protein
MSFFDKNTKTWIQNLFKTCWNHGAFHWIYIKLNKNFEKNWSNKSKLLEYFLIWVINMVFKSTYSLKKFNETNLCETMT